MHVLMPQINAILLEIHLSASRLLVSIPAVVILWSIILALVYTSCGLGFFFIFLLGFYIYGCKS